MLNHDFKLKPSKIYIVLMSVILIGSLGIIVTLPILFMWRILGAILILIYGSYILWHFGFLRSNRAIIAIRQEKDGRWYAQSRLQDLPVDILGDSIVTNVITVLRFRVSNRWYPTSCIVLRDSLGLDLYRKLLVALRMM